MAVVLQGPASGGLQGGGAVHGVAGGGVTTSGTTDKLHAGTQACVHTTGSPAPALAAQAGACACNETGGPATGCCARLAAEPRRLWPKVGVDSECGAVACRAAKDRAQASAAALVRVGARRGGVTPSEW